MTDQNNSTNDVDDIDVTDASDVAGVAEVDATGETENVTKQDVSIRNYLLFLPMSVRIEV